MTCRHACQCAHHTARSPTGRLGPSLGRKHHSDTALHGELSLAMQLAVHARGSRQLELKERLPRGVDLLDALGAQAERFAQHQPEELVDGDAVGARGED